MTIDMLISNDNRAIYMFKSSYRDLYKRQNLTLLSLPEGFNYTLEYEKRWVDPCLLDKDVILNKRGAIFLIDKHQNENADEGFIIPFRACMIRRLRMRGPIFIVDFKLGPFLSIKEEKISNKTAGNYRDRQIQKFIRGSLEHLKPPSYMNAGSYVQLNEFPENAFEYVNDKSHWYKMVDCLSSFAEYSNSVFLRAKIVPGFGYQAGFDSSGESPQKTYYHESRTGNVGYELEIGKKAAIHYSFYNPNLTDKALNSMPKRILFYSDGNTCRLPQEKVYIPVSKYNEDFIVVQPVEEGTTGIFLQGESVDEFNAPYCFFYINIVKRNSGEDIQFPFGSMEYNVHSAELLFRLETSLRNFVNNQATALSGEKWINNVIPNLLPDLRKRRKGEKRFHWLHNEDLSLLYYATLPELRQIIAKKNLWNRVFKKYFRRHEELEMKLQEIEAIRNAVAHNRPITEEIYRRLKMYYEDIQSMIHING